MESSADSSLPNIQAICRVVLKNGNVMEGFVHLGSGGEQGKLWMDGFYLEELQHPKQIFFDFDFFRLDVVDDNEYRYRLTTSSNQHILLNGYGLKLLSWKQANNVFSEPSLKLIYENGENYWTKELTIKEKYLLEDSISIFSSLGWCTFVGYRSEKQSLKKVALIDIRSFELLKDPPEEWKLKIIESNRLCNEEMERENNPGDFAMPIWYHEYLLNPDQYIKTRIEINREY